MQQRREEIIAKTAKLAELKRQRELRANQSNAGRQSVGGAPEVGFYTDNTRVHHVDGSFVVQIADCLES